LSEAERSFLVAWLAGILALVGALSVARWSWRTEIPPFGRQRAVFEILRHPERYSRPGSVRLIKGLAWLGWACLAAGLASLAFEAIAPSRVR